MEFLFSFLLILSFLSIVFFTGVSATEFTIVNKCDYTVWPGILGNTQLESTGFELSPGAARTLHAPPGWSGRFWGRTGCSFDPATGQGGCQTADCGSNQMECKGGGATPPATLAEFTIGGEQDFYDVSLVDGYNIAMVVEATGGRGGACGTTGCAADLNRRCPAELRAEEGKGCRSACGAFGNPEYCCSGAYSSPAACGASMYSEMFKMVCPKSYSYAFDDATSTFTCTGADYTITFCPSSTSQKSERDTSSRERGPSISFDSSWLPDFITGGGSSKTVVLSSTLNFTLFLFLLSLDYFSFFFLSLS